MKRHRSIPLQSLHGGTAALLLLSGIFFLGGAAGCFVAANIDGPSGAALREYLQSYLLAAQEDAVHIDFWHVIREQLQTPILILLLGFTAVGALGIPVLFAARGFAFAFSAAGFFRMFGAAGMVPALVLFGLPSLLWGPAMFVLGSLALYRSCGMMLGCISDRPKPRIVQQPAWFWYIVCFFVLIFCAVLEFFLLPVLVSLSAQFVLGA